MWDEHQKKNEQNLSEEQFKEQNRSMVVHTLKWEMIKHKIVEENNIEVTDDELKVEIDRLVEIQPKEKIKIRSLLKGDKHRNQLRDRLLNDKFWQFLKEQSKIKESIIKKPKKEKPSLIV